MIDRRDIPYTTWVIWGVLVASATWGLFSLHWTNTIVSIAALLLTVLPVTFAKRYKIRLPLPFMAAISIFVFSTLFLGEVFDFYERFWWWDLALHGISAVGFGIVGFLFVFYLFQGDLYAAPPWALALFAFSFAVTIGTMWEIFEFAMDQSFGLNMQKSGLVDTMSDLIVDACGAFIGSFSGFLWLKGIQHGLSPLIEEFVQRNRTGFHKLRRRDRTPSE